MNPFQRLKEQRRRILKQKEDTINTVLTSAKDNPKFIKLLLYSLNSLENFVSPPNREIRINASITIRLEGVGVLHKITITNITNEEIVTQSGRIMWKWISLHDIVDQELAKLFAEKKGQDAVIEILLAKEKKGAGTIPYIKILNGLVQIPQLISKLLESGLAESVKWINEWYTEDIEILAINFDTMKKISNQKVGRDFLIEKNVLESLWQNIKNCSDAQNSQAVLSGLNVVDNLWRNEKGKEAIKAANGIECWNYVLDKFENDEQILKICGKIYSKIATKEDLLKETEILKRNLDSMVKGEEDKVKYSEINKSLVLVSNLMLVEEISKSWMESENLELLEKLFIEISKIKINDKDADFVNTYILINKNFMVIFNRLFQNKLSIYDKTSEFGAKKEELLNTIYNSMSHIWEYPSLKTNDKILGTFKKFYHKYNDIVCKHYYCIKNNQYDSSYISKLMYLIDKIIIDGETVFKQDVSCDWLSSRILKISDEIAKNDDKHKSEIIKSISAVYPYMNSVFVSSKNKETLSNVIDVIYSLLLCDPAFQKKNIDSVISSVANFMSMKNHFRRTCLICLKILDKYLVNDILTAYLKDQANSKVNYVNCIVEVMTKNSNEPADEIDNNVEDDIKAVGGNLLQRWIDVKGLEAILKHFKETVDSYKSDNLSKENTMMIQKCLLTVASLLNVQSFYKLGAADILSSLSVWIMNEVNFIEGYKRDKENMKKANYQDTLKICSNKLMIELNIVIFINTLSTERSEYAIALSSVEILMLFLSKSSDWSNICKVLEQLSKISTFVVMNENNWKMDKNEIVTEKLSNVVLAVLRRLIEEESILTNIIDTIIVYTEKKIELCNILVKGGCPRLLLQIMETTSDSKTAEAALHWLKWITLSNSENLAMIANQNVLLKFFELRSKFVGNHQISADCDAISNEILKLPGQDKYVEDVINEAIAEFNQNAKLDYSLKDTKEKLLSNIEIIASLSSNQSQIEKIKAKKDFIQNLSDIFARTVKDNEVTQVNEKLWTNEIFLMGKIREGADSDHEEKEIESFLNQLLEIIEKKSAYREILWSSSRWLSPYIKNENKYTKHLSKKVDTKFIDTLFDVNENYWDDSEVSKEINNMLCYLCLRNDKFADYIKQRGGLANIWEELKALVGMNDETSRQWKQNGLRMLNSLSWDENGMNAFIKANGLDLVNNIIKNELTLLSQKGGKVTFFSTNEIINWDESACEDTENMKNSYLIYWIKIMKNAVDKGHKQFGDEKQLSDWIKIADMNYPDKYMFKELCDFCQHKAIQLSDNTDDILWLVKVAISLRAKYFNDIELKENMNKMLNDLLFAKIKSDNFAKKFTEERNSCTDADDKNWMFTYVALLCLISQGYEELITKNENWVQIIIGLYDEIFTSISNNDKAIPQGVVLALLLMQIVLTQHKKAEFTEEKWTKWSQIVAPFFKANHISFIDEYLKWIDTLISPNQGKLQTLDELIKQSNEIPKLTGIQVLFYQFIFNESINTYTLFNKKIKETTDYTSLPAAYKNVINSITIKNERYLSSDDDLGNKSKSIADMFKIVVETINSVADCTIISKDELDTQWKALWSLLYKTLLSSTTIPKESNVNLITEENVINVFELLDITIQQDPDFAKDNRVITDWIYLLCKIIDNNSNNSFEKLLPFIANNWTCTPPKNVENNWESLAILTKFSAVSKWVLKNTLLFNSIKDIYNDANCSLKNRRNISTIYSNIIRNSYNIDDIIIDHPSTLQAMCLKLSDEKNVIKSPENLDIAGNEIDNIIVIMKDPNNYKQITTNKIITDEELQKGICNYKDVNDVLSQKWLVLQNIIEEHRIQKKEQANIKIDQAILENLQKRIEAAFNEHMNELNKLNMNQDSGEGKEGDTADTGEKKVTHNLGFVKRMSTMVTPMTILHNTSTVKKGRLTIISKNLFYNPNNSIIQSPLSTKSKPDMSNGLDSWFALIRLLYNNNRQCNDEEMKKMRENLLLDALRLMKMLSICPDNHKTIVDVGLLDFMERWIADGKTCFIWYIACWDIWKNCTWSEGAVISVLECSIFDHLINEVVMLYDQPELLNSNEMKSCFFYHSINFSNICKCQRGFDLIFQKIGIEKLRNLGVMTGNVDFLTSIIEMIINYIVNNNIQFKPDAELETKDEEFLKDWIKISEKGLTIQDKSESWFSKSLKLIGLIYCERTKEIIIKMDIVKKVNAEFNNYKVDPEFLINSTYTIARISEENTDISTQVVQTKLLDEIVNCILNDNDLNTNLELLENVSLLFKNLVMKNEDNCKEICKDQKKLDFIITSIEKYSRKGKENSQALPTVSGMIQSKPTLKKTNANANTNANTHVAPSGKEEVSTPELRIVFNFVTTLDCWTFHDSNIHAVAKTKYLPTLLESLKQTIINWEIIGISLHCLGNYFLKDTVQYWKHSEIEQLYSILKELQKKYYANSNVLTNINHISGCILRGFDSKIYTQKYYLLIVESLNCQDWNIPLVLLTLKIIKESLTQHEDLQSDVFDLTKQTIFNWLRLYFNNIEIQDLCYNILLIFASSPGFSYFLVNSDIMPIVRDSLKNEEFNMNWKNRNIIRTSVLNLLTKLSVEEGHSKKISIELMEQLLKDLNSSEYNEDNLNLGRLFSMLLRHKSCVDIFIQLEGLTIWTGVMKNHGDKAKFLLIWFKMISAWAYSSEEVRSKWIELEYVDIIKECITKNESNKKVNFEGKIILCWITMQKGQSQVNKQYKEVNYDDINHEKILKNKVIPFWTTGKLVKIITPKDKEKEMLLVFSKDLTKVYCKNAKANWPPKVKYTWHVWQITNVIKGYGTEKFTKSTGLFKSAPKVDTCFSIIGQTTPEGTKSLNVVCYSDKDATAWWDNINIALDSMRKRWNPEPSKGEKEAII